jgi:uncharacterized short protein YbdD (DUF466 family)
MRPAAFIPRKTTLAATARLRRTLRRVWRGIREWCGDSAYERYLRSSFVQTGKSRTLSAEEFYVEQLNRRYSRPNRCC